MNLHLGICLVVLLAFAGTVVADSPHFGYVTFGGLPVPGVTITATQGERQVVTVSDQDGVYRFASLPDGAWILRVEMIGFSTITQEMTLPTAASPPVLELHLLPFEEIAKGLPSSAARSQGSQQAVTLTPSSDSEPASQAAAPGFQRAVVNTAATRVPVTTSGPADDSDADVGMGAADGFLINGSVNNAAASPFAQPRAFGNSRPGGRSLYTGRYGIQFGNSAWDARPYSLTGQPTAQPSYQDSQILATFGGPVKFPRIRNRANLFVGYQRSLDTSTTTQSALMPTTLERSGDFSQTRDALGQPVEILDPVTRLPFPAHKIPSERISPQAAALLQYYPLPDPAAAGRFNYQAPVITGIRQDSVQTRLIHPVNARNQVSATVAYQRTTTDTKTLFGFDDTSEVSGLDAQAEWFQRVTQSVSFRWRYQFTRMTTTVTPYFAYRTNVSGEAGVSGSNQSPVNWGPPSLTFSSGVAGLVDAIPAFNRAQSHNWSAQGYWSRGRHNLTFGGDMRLQDITILSQQDPRGSFAFTGVVTGFDLADFLLGIPHTSAIAYGNADKYFDAPSYDAYITNDWRISPTLSVNIGVRWEYEAPITEALGRLVNLDVVPGYEAVDSVTATSSVGPLTGRHYPDSLVNPDKYGLQPRVAMAWRPVPGSSLVVRAGYGVYRNTTVYQPIATLLAQQSPLSTAFSVENDPGDPFTMANAFVKVDAENALSTFAVDPDFRVGYVHSWQASIQRDFPASLTVIGSYLGSKGSRLMQQFLPNTYPVGGVNPCPTCPSGFRYLTSTGDSLRQAGQVQVRRRLRNGLSATIQYTFARSTDDATAFGGATLDPAALAQDWLDLHAEYGPSSFDQRHLVAAQVEYTTGAGVAGGTLIDGLKGRLFKDWTFVAQLTTGSGLPLTPLYLTAVSGTGVVGPIRAATTGAPRDDVADGYYLNPAAYAVPAVGQWGNSGRNSVVGPSQFALNAAIMRTFRLGDRLNLDWRVDAINVLNQVTFASVNMFVTSPQFGLPNRANDMRKLRTSLRVRF